MEQKSYPSPFGEMIIQGDQNGISRLDFNRSKILPANDKGELAVETSLLDRAYLELSEYFKGEREKFTIPLNFQSGTAFMQKVWQALYDIPYGTLVTYKDIAEEIGHPKAYRAVGMANNKNPISIICACHRVIGSSGNLVGYGWGLDMKEALLKIEGVSFKAHKPIIL